MENLCLHRITGEPLTTLDLTDKKHTLILGTAPTADVPLAEYLRPEDTPIAPIAAALVRDEDGWIIAAADPEHPPMLGTVKVLEVRLTPGLSCRIGDILFRIESETLSRSAITLLWKAKGMKETHCSPLLDGSNTVATLPGSDIPEVNPPVVEEERFRIVLEGEMVTILMPERDGVVPEWLRVGLGEGFCVGDFTGVALPTTEAEKALKTRTPLAWPGRKMRARLNLYLICGLLLAALMMMVMHKIHEMQAFVADRNSISHERPATQASFLADATTLPDDVRVYELDFHRSLASNLTAEHQPNLDFLLERGAVLHARAEAEKNQFLIDSLDRKVVLLRDVRTIKEAVLKTQWTNLRNAVANANPAVFHYYDGEIFLHDAAELSTFVSETLPALFNAAANTGVEEFKKADEALIAGIEGLRDNRFATEAVSALLQETAFRRWAALRAYVNARATFLANPLDITALTNTLETFSEFEDLLAESSEDMVNLAENERLRLNDIACATLRARLDNPEQLHLSDEKPLRELARFLRAIGGDRTVEQETLRVVDAMTREATRQWRALHTKYRLQTISKDPEAPATLEAMIALGPSESHFYQWAVREQARVKASPDTPPEELPEVLPEEMPVEATPVPAPEVAPEATPEPDADDALPSLEASESTPTQA